MPITVPKPITAPPPVQVTHTPYNTANAAWNANQNANQQFFSGGSSFAPIPVGTILSQSQPQQALAPKPVPPPTQISSLANTPNGFYKPPNQGKVNSYLNYLKAGFNIDPTTGGISSPGMAARGFGGGVGQYVPGMQGYRVRGGITDPVAAAYAIQQYQKNLDASGQYVDPNAKPYVDPDAAMKEQARLANIGQAAVPAGFWGGSNVVGQPMAVPAGWGQQSNVNQAASARAAQQAAVPAAMQVSTKGYRNY